MEGRDGRGWEGSGGEGGREGEGVRREGRGGMTVIHILMAPQYLYNSHVLRNNVSQHSIGSTPFARRTMVRNYVRRDVGHPDRVTNKVLEAGVQTSYVHSSKKSIKSRISSALSEDLAGLHL